MGKNKRKYKETKLMLPVGLVTGISSVVARLIDTDKPLSKTNISTATGGGLMGAAYVLINSPDEISQSLGYLLLVIGFGISWYKENKKK